MVMPTTRSAAPGCSRNIADQRVAAVGAALVARPRGSCRSPRRRPAATARPGRAGRRRRTRPASPSSCIAALAERRGQHGAHQRGDERAGADRDLLPGAREGPPPRWRPTRPGTTTTSRTRRPRRSPGPAGPAAGRAGRRRRSSRRSGQTAMTKRRAGHQADGQGEALLAAVPVGVGAEHGATDRAHDEADGEDGQRGQQAPPGPPLGEELRRRRSGAKVRVQRPSRPTRRCCRSSRRRSPCAAAPVSVRVSDGRGPGAGGRVGSWRCSSRSGCELCARHVGDLGVGGEPDVGVAR